MNARNHSFRAIVVGVAVLVRLAFPVLVHADDRRPPSATETPIVEPTKMVSTESPTPSQVDTLLTKPGVDWIATKTPAVDVPETSTPTDSPEIDTELTKPSTVESDPSETVQTETSEALDKPALIDVLQDLIGENSVVVLDENGQPLPLVSRATAEVVEQSDPMWCPEGVPPGGIGCTSAYATLNDLLTNAGAYINSQNVNGIIWITAGTIADTAPITIDGINYTNWSNYTLTLQGGWSGVNGDTTIVANSVFSSPITITNWNNGLIIHAIEAPVFNVSNVTSTQGESVWITYANGNVNLNNIHVDRATDAGVYIDTAGEIIANNISATYNNIRGAILYGTAGVSLTGTNVFNHNVGDGLVISTAGSITLENVTASHNTATGAYLFGGTITITGTNFFDDNVLYGGEFYGTELSLDGVSFSGNDIAGLSATSVGDVTLNNVIASENTSDGIWVQSDGGNMVLSNLTASKNSSGATFVGASTVTLTGRNVFYDNSAMGLGIDAAGDIKVSNVTANSNSDGISLFSAFGAISIDGSNRLIDNSATGLTIYGWGNVTLSDITIQNSLQRHGVYGVSIGTIGDVTLNNVVSSGNDTGVSIFTFGNVNLSEGSISNNGIGLSVYCVTTLNFNVPLTRFANNMTDILIQRESGCPVTTVNLPPAQPLTFIAPQGELFTLDCSKAQNRYVVRLANGDRGEIYCPVEGEASIDRIDNTNLPANLPAGYTYASAFDVKILKNGSPISVIEDEGYITASFLAQYSEFGTDYSILYWDANNNVWIPLKDFLQNEKGKPESFELYPGTSDDKRKVLSGVHVVTKNGESRVEVSTNFPGIFVLAQH